MGAHRQLPCSGSSSSAIKATAEQHAAVQGRLLQLTVGKCDASQCTYKNIIQVTESKIDGVITKMRPALAQFVLANN